MTTKKTSFFLCLFLLTTGPVKAMDKLLSALASSPTPATQQPAIKVSIPTLPEDIGFYRFSANVAPEVKSKKFKGKCYIDLLDFTVTTTYQMPVLSLEDQPSLIKFTFAMDPKEEPAPYLSYMSEHQSLKGLLTHFYTNLTYSLSPKVEPEKKLKIDIKEGLYSRENEIQVRYLATLQEMINPKDGKTLPVTTAVIDNEHLKLAINILNERNAHKSFEESLEKDHKKQKATELTAALLNSKDFHFIMKFRNPRDRGVTTIALNIIPAPQDIKCTLPIFQGEIETFIHTHFLRLVMTKISEFFMDVAYDMTLAMPAQQMSYYL